jgi:hypothetical protein
VIQAHWERNEESAVQIAWAKELRDRLAPYATGGAYTNFVAADELHRVRAAHGAENYHRLQDLKSKYDPGERFSRQPERSAGPAETQGAPHERRPEKLLSRHSALAAAGQPKIIVSARHPERLRHRQTRG